MNTITLRKASLEDLELLFKWRNDKQVRLNSLNTDFVLFEQHSEWFLKNLTNRTCKIFILQVDSTPVGTIRLDYRPSESGWVISFSVDPLHRSKGFGKLMVGKCVQECQLFPLIAYVKKDNISSLKIFESLGFNKLDNTLDIPEHLFKFIKRHA